MLGRPFSLSCECHSPLAVFPLLATDVCWYFLPRRLTSSLLLSIDLMLLSSRDMKECSSSWKFLFFLLILMSLFSLSPSSSFSSSSPFLCFSRFSFPASASAFSPSLYSLSISRCRLLFFPSSSLFTYSIFSSKTKEALLLSPKGNDDEMMCSR